MKSEEQRLLALFGTLDDRQRETLIAFGEFLVTRASQGSDAEPSAPDRPLPILRPETETVVMAIKRLAQTYPMLDRRKLLGDASKYVAQHALEGRSAAEVIDELEVVFSRHYENLRSS